MEDAKFLETMQKHREEYHKIEEIMRSKKERRSNLLLEAQVIADELSKLKTQHASIEQRLMQTTRLWFS